MLKKWQMYCDRKDGQKVLWLKSTQTTWLKYSERKQPKIYTLESLNALNKCCDKDTINIQHLGLGLGLSLGM